MLKIFKDREKKERKGSALLIVLGFLSFMIISAVAFAVYMRIERQASSNYRHASSARHLINAALYRAIDEIDSELRIQSINGTANARKFPDWPGRVRNSAVVNATDNDGDARVLTLDSLGYIPAILVNDVRRYAVKPSVTTVGTYEGPKWRNLSMPDKDMEGNYAYNEAVVGRYAYTCINVSDMLNVNSCKVTVRDADKNRVSLSQLFADQSAGDDFDKAVEEEDHRYSTLSDFYACMYKRSDTTFGSPYHNFLESGNDTEFDYASKHILVTDGKAMAEPLSADDAYNVRQGTVLNLAANNPVLGTYDREDGTTASFETALRNLLAGTTDDYGNYNSAFPQILADYLDDDHLPKGLDIASVELAPMLCAVQLDLADYTLFTVDSSQDIDGDGNPDTAVYLNIPTALPFSVKTVYPFLETSFHSGITDKFEVDMSAHLLVYSDSAGLISSSSAIRNQATILGGGLYDYAFYSNPQANSFTPNKNARTSSPYNLVSVDCLPVSPQPNPPKIQIWNSVGGGTAPDSKFPLGCKIGMTVYVSFLGIRDPGQNQFVDTVPNFDFPVAPTQADYNFLKNMRLFSTTASPNRLYFATDISVSPVVGAGITGAEIHHMVWNELETPDPRFNWKIANWVKGTMQPTTHNQSTLDFLTDGTGRDSDIYMSVSDAGEMYSPGELGYLVRPYKDNNRDGAEVDFSAGQAVALNDCEDKDAMFRTFRLYDQGGIANEAAPTANEKQYFRHDDIYQHLFAAKDDKGSFDGMRVNPLSDIPIVLGAAIENVPFDYWLVDNITDTLAADQSVSSTIRSKNYSEMFSGTSWDSFTNGWVTCFLAARNSAGFNTSLSKNLRDVYNSHQYFGWYSDNTTLKQVFQGTAGVTTLAQDLYGVDREMLYSFTLESFSDRQQLFLYIINAEATADSFGKRARSLAGGRAIALVWRDPYPARDASSTEIVPGNMYPSRLISPWHQYYIGQNETDSTVYEGRPDVDNLSRDLHYFENRILFFKYLDR